MQLVEYTLYALGIALIFALIQVAYDACKEIKDARRNKEINANFSPLESLITEDGRPCN